MDKQVMDQYVRRYCSDAELSRRWQLAVKAMESHHLDYIIAVQRTDYLGGYVKWFTDLPTSWEYACMALFSKEKEMTTIWHGSPAADNNPPPYYSRGITKRLCGGHLPSLNYTCTDDARLLVKELAPMGAVRVGIAGLAYMTVQCYNYLLANLPKATIIDFTDEIDELRAVKSGEEIELIREACEQQDEVMALVKDLIVPGIREYEIYAAMKHQCSLRGAENGVYLVSSNSNCGPVPYYMEHFHSNRVIEKGDSVFVCIETNGPSGHYANLARLFVLGDPTDDMMIAYEFFIKARDYHLSLLKPGASCPELLRLHNEFMREHGWPEEDRLLSHGQGYDLVERPAIVPGETMLIKANMNITPHPTAVNARTLVNMTENWITQEKGLPICLNKFPAEIITVK